MQIEIHIPEMHVQEYARRHDEQQSPESCLHDEWREAHDGQIEIALVHALLTRMHERYLYLAVVGLAPFVMEARFRRLLLVVSACVFLNVHFGYVYFDLHSASPGSAWAVAPLFDAVFGTSRDAWQLKLWSALVAATCLTIATLGWRWLEPPAAPTAGAT